MLWEHLELHYCLYTIQDTVHTPECIALFYQPFFTSSTPKLTEVVLLFVSISIRIVWWSVVKKLKCWHRGSELQVQFPFETQDLSDQSIR